MRINHYNGGEKSPSIMIMTPSYDGNYCYQYVQSLLGTLEDLRSHGIGYQVEFLVHDNFIHRARNTLVKRFMESDCTHALMIDADQGWDPKAPYKMLKRDKEIIVGAVRQKVPEEGYSFQIRTNLDRTPLMEGDLINTFVVGLAFALVNKKAIERMTTEDIKRKDYYSYFDDTYSHDGILIGEDITFCNRYNKAGGQIYMMPDIDITHGEFLGNYHRYLLRQPRPDYETIPAYSV